MEVARDGLECRRLVVEAFEFADVDVDDLALAFDGAVGEEEGAEACDAPVFLEGVAPDDEVGDAGFVFQGDEDDSGGGAGALAAEDDAGDADAALGGAAFFVAEVGGGEDAEGGEVFAEEGDGMCFEGEADGAVVVEDAVFGGDVGEAVQAGFVGGVGGVEEGEVVVAEGFDLPEGALAVEVHGCEGVGLGEAAEGAGADAAGAPEGVDGVEWAVGADGVGDFDGVGFGHAFDEAHAEAEGGAGVAPVGEGRG